jgi:arabinan endo-1,5-alpha-L-arabinosidase
MLTLFPIPNRSRQWLSYGSFFGGIAIIELDPSTGKAKSGAKSIGIASRPNVANNPLEAPAIVKNGNYWYLFMSWDKVGLSALHPDLWHEADPRPLPQCCSGTSSTYNTRVVRSSSITGPYVDKAGVSALNGGGTLVLASHDSIIGPGGASVIQDGSQWCVLPRLDKFCRTTTDILLTVLPCDRLLVYHYYTSTSSNLGINLLDFSSGWPVVF